MIRPYSAEKFELANAPPVPGRFSSIANDLEAPLEFDMSGTTFRKYPID
jgi:hypothetical protein